MLTSKSRLPVREILLIGLWPSFVKKLIYRLKGYRIGSGVHLGFGSVIVGRSVEIGDGVRLGFFAAIRGDTLKLGHHVQIGAVTMIDTPYVEIGEGTKFNEQVYVGGLQFPDSRFVVGRNCLIMQSSYINPCRSIVIGDDSGVGVDCLLIGHASWQSKFEGYPVTFQPIVIGNSVALAWRVTVLPGTKIGDGATIGANSLVKETIPPRCLAVGSPARVVAREPYFPRRVSDDEKQALLREIVFDLIHFLNGHGIPSHEVNGLYVFEVPAKSWLPRKPKVWRLRVGYDQPVVESAGSGFPDADLFLSLFSIPQSLRNVCDRHEVTWIDVEKKERSEHGNAAGEEVIHFLKRYGLRLLRVPPSVA